MKYRVLSIDAWGNPEDGWDQNDYSLVGHIELRDGLSDAEILEAMCDAGFTSQPTGGSVDVWDGENGAFDVLDAETHEPLFQCQAIEDES